MDPDREAEKLWATDLPELLQRARADTFEYCRLKRKNGTKFDYRRDVGVGRRKAADASLNHLDIPAQDGFFDSLNRPRRRPGAVACLRWGSCHFSAGVGS